MQNSLFNRRQFLQTAGLTAALCISGSFQCAWRKRPNILFIFTDDHAYQAISAYGSNRNKTPNIDRIANGGMLFKNCCVTNSLCAPSRAVILTGKHSHVNGVRDNREEFDPHQQTFPKLLRENGYQTAIIGKWHLKTQPSGFDYWDVLPGQGHYYNPDFKSMLGTHRETGYVTDIITDKALNWLQKERNPEEPFMLMVQHKAPHREWSPAFKYLEKYKNDKIPEPETLFDDYKGRGTPAHEQEMTINEHMMLGHDLKMRGYAGTERLERRIHERMNEEQREQWTDFYQPVKEKFEKASLEGKDLVRWKYQRYLKDYLRCIASVDESVGKLLDYLDESGMADNTVVVYSSDQGFYLGEHGWFDKRFMYEESFKMPLLVRWPGRTKPGTVNDDLVSNLDFAETFLDIANIEIPQDMQGLSLEPLLRGRKPDDWRKSVYYHYYEFPGAHNVHRHEGVYDGRYKLIHYYQIEEWELFDLKKDPHELTSVYDESDYQPVVERLKRILEELKIKYQVPEESDYGKET